VKIALDLGAGGWLGGRYYLQNLALALATLPDGERPELVGLDAPGSDGLGGTVAAVTALPEGTSAVFPNWSVDDTGPVVQLSWIPDLQHRALPRNFSLLERLKREVGYRRFARRAAAVVVSSEIVRHAVAGAYPRTRPKLQVVRFRTVVPVDATTGRAREKIRHLDVPEDFLLLPNQFWVHKNHRLAFEALPRLELPLVCTGATDDHRHPGHLDELRALLRAGGVEDRAHILGVVSREDYLQLLRASRAVVQPSRFEGWSSVVEDARALGKPVALSDTAVHREQDPPRAAYFGLDDPEGLVDAVRTVLELDPVEEATAVLEHRELVTAYARRFLEVVGWAVERRR
jgi:glycosyltransferase involved in cell wall biosynthesis